MCWRRLTVSATALTAVLLLGACGDGGRPQGAHTAGNGSPSSRMSPTPTPASRADDVFFAQMMVPHLEQVSQTADLAVRTTTASKEVQSLARQIREVQETETQTMRDWLHAWGAPAPPVDHDGTHNGMMMGHDMATLATATPAAFDHMWLTTMIKHQLSTVSMAKEVLSITTDPDVKTLAQAIVDRQTPQIAKMQQLLR